MAADLPYLQRHRPPGATAHLWPEQQASQPNHCAFLGGGAQSYSLLSVCCSLKNEGTICFFTCIAFSLSAWVFKCISQRVANINTEENERETHNCTVTGQVLQQVGINKVPEGAGETANPAGAVKASSTPKIKRRPGVTGVGTLW